MAPANKPVVGPCRADIRSWTFDIDSNTCREFVYGGCGGTLNNFKTEEQCKKHCLGKSKPYHIKSVNQNVQAIDKCSPLGQNKENKCAYKPAVRGHCNETYKRWTYFPHIGMCRLFGYSGCGGNDNNFVTLSECEKNCVGNPYLMKKI